MRCFHAAGRGLLLHLWVLSTPGRFKAATNPAALSLIAELFPDDPWSNQTTLCGHGTCYRHDKKKQTSFTIFIPCLDLPAVMGVFAQLEDPIFTILHALLLHHTVDNIYIYIYAQRILYDKVFVGESGPY